MLSPLEKLHKAEEGRYVSVSFPYSYRWVPSKYTNPKK